MGPVGDFLDSWSQPFSHVHFPILKHHTSSLLLISNCHVHCCAMVVVVVVCSQHRWIRSREKTMAPSVFYKMQKRSRVTPCYTPDLFHIDIFVYIYILDLYQQWKISQTNTFKMVMLKRSHHFPSNFGYAC